MITEVFPGVFYQYHERENSWICITGYESIKPATQIEPGLMTKEDFIKVDSLLTSPPRTTLTSDQCDATFSSGVIKLYSRDKSLFIEDYLDLYETGNTTREQWHIHEDTWGFNFRVNLQFLVEEMKERGNLISETIVGPKGPPGDRGEPGIDKLDTGPRGAPGEDGRNAPFGGGLTNTSGLVIKDKSRAVVHVGTEMISPEENYLVVHKGVISPEKLCVRKVEVENAQSTWVLVRNQKGIVCSNGCITSYSCEDQTAFIDVEIITNSIREHTNSLILKLKSEKEQQVREWMRTMMKVFNDQKYALCCGLENCRSRKRNQDERRYIETSRISAAGAGFNLIISGSRDGEDVPEPHTKVELDMDEFKDCQGPGWEPTVVTPVNPITLKGNLISSTQNVSGAADHNRILIHTYVTPDVSDTFDVGLHSRYLTINDANDWQSGSRKGDLILWSSAILKIHIYSGVTRNIFKAFDPLHGIIPTGLAVYGGNLITCNWTDRKIYVCEGITTNVLRSFPTPGHQPQGLVVDSAGNLISYDADYNKIYKHVGITQDISDSYVISDISAHDRLCDLAIDRADNLVGGARNMGKIFVYDGISPVVSDSFDYPGPVLDGITIK